MALHRCAARGCEQHISVVLLMCPGHWRRVPRRVAKRVWETYRGGNVQRGPYLEARSAAVAHVAVFEGKTVTPEEVAAMKLAEGWT